MYISKFILDVYYICEFITLFFTLRSFETKMGSNFYFGTGYLFLSQNVQIGFISYILIDKNTFFSRHWLFRDTIIQSQFKILLQNIYSSMERIIQDKICNILLKKWKIMATLQMSKSIFPCDRPDGPEEESGCQLVFHPV
jgi:hypothetical protein